MNNTPTYPSRPDEIAAEVLAVLDGQGQIEPISERLADFDLETAYAVAAAVRRLREARGERVVGRKIGFTSDDLGRVRGWCSDLGIYLQDDPSSVRRHC